jgi:hypothetical protein
MTKFLASGGAVADRAAGSLQLSRVFLWFGGDFTRRDRMPTWLPTRRSSLVAALRPWLDPELVAWITATTPQVEFQPYDWSLACSIG